MESQANIIHMQAKEIEHLKEVVKGRNDFIQQMVPELKTAVAAITLIKSKHAEEQGQSLQSV